VVVDDLPERFDMLCYCFETWFDESFETQQVSSRIPTRLVPTHKELSDVESEEIKTCLTVHPLQGVGQASFAGFQFETDRL
jgi:hypothetical protein